MRKIFTTEHTESYSEAEEFIILATNSICEICENLREKSPVDINNPRDTRDLRDKTLRLCGFARKNICEISEISERKKPH